MFKDEGFNSKYATSKLDIYVLSQHKNKQELNYIIVNLLEINVNIVKTACICKLKFNKTKKKCQKYFGNSTIKYK